MLLDEESAVTADSTANSNSPQSSASTSNIWLSATLELPTMSITPATSESSATTSDSDVEMTLHDVTNEGLCIPNTTGDEELDKASIRRRLNGLGMKALHRRLRDDFCRTTANRNPTGIPEWDCD